MEAQPKVKQVRDVTIPEAITVQELSNRMAERAADVIK
jgi:translation initiation factor IF-2